MQSLVIDPRARQLVLATFAMAMAAVLGILALGQTVPAHAINPPGTVGVVCGHTCPSGTDDYSRAEGSADTVNVANFTGTGAPSDFTASINWGDGSPIGGGTISSPSAGNFVVAGTHPYADEASAGAPYVIVVTITGVNSANDNGNGAQATITEGDALTSTNTPASVSATENTQFSGTVATFTDSFSNPGSDFTADIAWGDGNTDTGLPVTGGSGSPLVVAGSHTYADEISSGTITVTVHDNAPGTGAWTATPSVTAAEADTLSGTGTAVAATENSSFTGQVASFTNTGYSSNVPADFSATINWGDGLTNDPGAVTGGGGSPLLVSGTHTYADECSCSVTATLTDNTPGSAQATSTTSTATVGEGDTAVAITGTSPINVNENVAIPATHVLGTFTTNYTGNIAGDFTVTVDWGDGSTSTGTLTGGAGTFTIKGGHTYGDECTCTVTVTVADNSPGGTATVSASNFANIADTDQITPSGSVITPTEGTSFSGTVGSFSTANTNNLASDFTASIDWGDTLTSAGTITGASGSFTVSGTHTYAEEGPHAVKITVTDDPLLPFPTGSNPVANPGFETGGLTGWTSSSTTANAVVAVNTTSHSGTWSARLGNPANDTTNGTNSLWQDIAIPPGVSALSTWIQPHCTDTVTFDQQRILLQTTGGGALATVMADACSDYGAAGDWRHITFDTSAYAGTTVRLLFQVHDDGQSDPTWMFVDDTRIQASPVISSTANVADAALVGSGGFLVTGVEGAPVNNMTLATFTDTDPGGLQGDAVHETSGDYTANIKWGDSTPDSAGTITGPDTNGVYTVTAATHTFPEEGGPGLTITITDNLQQAIVLANADIADAALTAHNTTLSSTEGVQFTQSVGTFSDADTGNDRGINPPGDYTADIDWGDGTAHSVGTVTGSAGSFDVAGTHTYAEQGPWTITTVVTDKGTATTTITSTTTTADNTLTNTPGTAIGATEGTQLSAVSLGGFHDNDPGEGPGELPSDYSVSIDWGDSTGPDTTTGVISGSLGQDFTVSGTHTYSEEGSATSIKATITDEATGSTTTITTPVTVDDAPLTPVGGTTNSGTEGANIPGITLATFQDTDPGEVAGETAGDYSATIDWGDGSALDTSAVVVKDTTPGQYHVTGSHTYGEEGTWVPTVIFTDVAGGNTATVSSGTDIVVSDALLTAHNVALTGAEDTALAAGTAVATFTDADPGGIMTDAVHETPGDYSGTIDWGDGNTGAPVTITGPDTNGLYTVTNTNPHTYTEGRNAYTVTVAVLDTAGGATATALSTANIADYAISANPVSGNIGTIEGQSFTGAVATLIDSDPNANAEGPSHYLATIDWGDATTPTSGVITGGGSTYTVSGTHTYVEEALNPLPISVTITDIGGAVVTPTPVVSHTQVSDAPLSGTVLPVNAVEGAIFNGPVAMINDSNPGAVASDFTAQITWGDGHSASGVVTGATGGPFTVTGSNIYGEESATASPPIGEVVVQVTDIGGASTATHILPSVADAAIVVSALSNTAATEGLAATNVPIATFTDADPNAGEALADIHTSINWGDFTSSAGTITGPVSGVYTIVGSHTYAEENAGRSAVATVTDDGGSTGSAGRTIVVNDGTLSGTIANLGAVTEGTALSGVTVATFTDQNPGTDATDFTATITWEGSTTSAGTVTNTAPGQYTVTGSHTYAEEGPKALSVLITDHNQTTNPSASLTVLDAALSSTAKTISGTEGQAFSAGQVATFTDADPAGTTGDYTVTINWNDGSALDTTSGAVTGPVSGVFSVTGTHTFAEEGALHPVVTITDAGGQPTAATDTANVADAALALVGVSTHIPAVEGTSLTANQGPAPIVATFTDADPNGTASDYTVSIDWGDGTALDTTTGLIAHCLSGDGCTGGTSAFKVVGTHTYAEEGAGKVVTVTVTDHGSPVSVNSTRADVSDATLYNAIPSNSAAGEAAPNTFSGVLGTWQDHNLGAAANDFTFHVDNWGDSSSGSAGTVGTITGGFSGTGSHQYASPGIYNVAWTAHDAVSTATGTTTVNIAFPPGPYIPLQPFRIFDTRPGSGVAGAGQRMGSNENRTLHVTGLGGVPTSGVQAVVLNVTGVGASSITFLTVYPTGLLSQPTASNLNLPAGGTRPNLVEVPVGVGGQVTIYNSAGAVDVLVDVEGYVSQAQNGTHGLFNTLPPARIFDTRTGQPQTYQGAGNRMTPNSKRDVQITGLGGVPASHVGAVVLNVTVTNASADSFGGYETIFPTGSGSPPGTPPTASNLNFGPGATVANRVIVPVDPATGKVTIYNYSGINDTIVDVSGWFTDGTDSTATGALYKAISPIRLCDTRDGTAPGCPAGRLNAGDSRTLQVSGSVGVPAIGATESPVAVVLNVTATGTSAWGFFTVYPSNLSTPPNSSDVNWTGPSQTVPNLVVAKLSPDGKITAYNPLGVADLIVDVFGWYTPAT